MTPHKYVQLKVCLSTLTACSVLAFGAKAAQPQSEPTDSVSPEICLDEVQHLPLFNDKNIQIGEIVLRNGVVESSRESILNDKNQVAVHEIYVYPNNKKTLNYRYEFERNEAGQILKSRGYQYKNGKKTLSAVSEHSYHENGCEKAQLNMQYENGTLTRLSSYQYDEQRELMFSLHRAYKSGQLVKETETKFEASDKPPYKAERFFMGGQMVFQDKNEGLYRTESGKIVSVKELRDYARAMGVYPDVTKHHKTVKAREAKREELKKNLKNPVGFILKKINDR